MTAWRASERPSTVLTWLGKGAVTGVLRELAAGQRPLSHAALDELPDGKPLRHLRTILVATGTLPPRDEQMARLETWISRAIAGRPGPDQRRLLHQYAVWHVVRRLRGRLAGQHATYGQALAAQRNVRAAIALLDWLAARGLTLENARQGDLDAWMGEAQASHRTDAGNFVRWARRNKLTRLDFAATRWGGPSGVIDTEARWEQARWLLHDDSLKPEDRVAGLLVLLYAQRATVISRLTLDQVTGRGRAGAHPARPRARRAPRTSRRPRPAARGNPPRPRRPRRRRHLGLAVPRRTARPADQRLPAHRAPAPDRHPLRPGPLRRAVPARHRPARRRPGPHARHPHRRRRPVAAAIRRRLDGLRRRRQPPDQTASRSVTSRNARPDVTGDARCPVCGRQLPDRDRPHGGRKARYCSGACKAKAYRARQQAGQPASTQPVPPAGRHARVIEIRQQVSELVSDMADTASGQQALFASPGAARRRTRPAETARTLHRLIAELAALAVAAAVTERVTIRQAPGGTMQTMPLFDEGGNGG